MNHLNIRYIGLISLILMLFSPIQTQADNANSIEFRSERHGFVVSYPTSYEEVSVPNSGVGLALRKKQHDTEASANDNIFTGGFPTITVTVHPGPFSVKSDGKKELDDILESYRTVGISDVVTDEFRAEERPEGRGLSATLAYSRGDRPFLSRIAVVPGKSHHYIVTYIDLKERFAAGVADIEGFLSSFKGGEMAPAPTKKRYPERDRAMMIFGALFAFLVIGGIILYQTRRVQVQAK